MILIPRLIALLLFLYLLVKIFSPKVNRKTYIFLLTLYVAAIYFFGGCFFNNMQLSDAYYYTPIPFESTVCDFKETSSQQDYGGNGRGWVSGEDRKNYYVSGCADKCPEGIAYSFVSLDEAKSCVGFNKKDIKTWCTYHFGHKN